MIHLRNPSVVPVVDTDAVPVVDGSVWMLTTGAVGAAGVAMGVMGLTYTQEEVSGMQLSSYSNGKLFRSNPLNVQ